MTEQSPRNRWTPWDDRARTGLRVYCLPHAGGSAATFLPWSRSQQEPGLHFVPVELPGRGTRPRETPARRMDEVADGLLDLLGRRPPDEPFALLGHSMGAQVAYEVARRLAGSGGRLPVLVAVAGGRPPGSPAAVALHDLSDEALLTSLVELGGTHPEVLQHKELMEIMTQILRADLTLLADYTEQVRPTPLPCPLLALGGSNDLMAGPEWIEKWAGTTSGRFRALVLPGDHFFLHARKELVMTELATHLRELSPR